MAPRPVSYELKLDKDGQMVVHARIGDSSGRVWSSKAQTMRAAYQDILEQLERAAGRKNLAARELLGVIEGPPARKPPSRKGPAQGGLL